MDGRRTFPKLQNMADWKEFLHQTKESAQCRQGI
nr:MAG TPA: hypothetical protein [Caudoviricetes sp.]